DSCSVHVHHDVEHVPVASSGHERGAGPNGTDRPAKSAGRGDHCVASGDGGDRAGDGGAAQRARPGPTPAEGRARRRRGQGAASVPALAGARGGAGAGGARALAVARDRGGRGGGWRGTRAPGGTSSGGGRGLGESRRGRASRTVRDVGTVSARIVMQRFLGL